MRQSAFDARKQLSIIPKGVLTREFSIEKSKPFSDIIDDCLETLSKDEVSRFFKRYLSSAIANNGGF